MKKITAICLLSLFTSFSLPSQEKATIKFDRITTENIIVQKGLSQNSGYAILQDKRGFMWFGTWDGLNRYDGYEFIEYDVESGLSHNTIRDLYEDDNGYLWIATEGGLDRLDMETGEIVIYRKDITVPNSLSDSYILDINPQGDVLWISTANGLNKYNMETGTFKRIKFYDGEGDPDMASYINRTYSDRSGNLWIATRYGLHKYDLLEDEYHPFYHDPADKRSLSSNNVNDVLEDSEGNIWIGTANGLNKMEPDSDGFVRYMNDKKDAESLSDNHVSVLYEDNKGHIWVGTSNMLNILDPETGKFRRLMNRMSSVSLSNNNILSIYEDPSGTIWVGTYKGINKVDKNSSRFPHYSHIPDDPSSLSNNIVYAINECSDDNLWVGTYGGLNIMDRAREEFTVLEHRPDDPNSIASNKIRAIVEDPGGVIWIGFENSGLDSYNKETGEFTHYSYSPDDTNSLIDNRIVAMESDNSGRIWIGTRSGLNVFDPETGIHNHITFQPGDTASLVSPVVLGVYLNSKEDMWVGTDYGVHVFDMELNRIESFYPQPDNPKALKGSRIMFIGEDADGYYWLGTIGSGLSRYDPLTGEFRNFGENEGLPNNVVYAALDDGNGFLWITTNKGLAKFDKRNESFVVYDAKDGIQGNEFNAGAYHQNEQGELFFGGMNGLNAFRPEDIRVNKSIPRLVITEVRVFNEALKGPFYDGDTIFLSYRDNFFSIKFAALEYTNPSKNIFRYKLENYDKDWITAKANRRVAEYKKVSSGSYTFRLIGANNDGIWNQEGITLNLVIRPPWWETWAFRILFAIVIIFSFWIIIYSRFKTLKKKHDVEKKMLNIEKEMFEIEQKALRLQMNPHFIFNSLNAIQSFVIANDTDKAIAYLAKFSHLMRMILANSSEAYIPLKDELKAVQYYIDLEKLRFDDKFEYEISVEDDIDEEFIEIPPMILQPYVENAIIHGLIHAEKKGQLEIIVSLEKKSMKCLIQDNGIGREKANELREQSGIKRQPRGMMITRERLDILKNQYKEDFGVKIIDLKDKKGRPAGTRVEITFHYFEA